MRLLPILKAAVLAAAAATAILRFVAYKYGDALPPQTRRALNAASAGCAAVLLACGIAWALAERKKARQTGRREGEDAT